MHGFCKEGVLKIFENLLRNHLLFIFFSLKLLPENLFKTLHKNIILQMWSKPPETADLVTFGEEIFIRQFHNFVKKVFFKAGFYLRILWKTFCKTPLGNLQFADNSFLNFEFSEILLSRNFSATDSIGVFRALPNI